MNSKVSFSGKLISKFMRFLTQYIIPNEVDNMASKKHKEFQLNQYNTEKDDEVSLIKLANARGFLLRKRNSNHKNIIYQIHGGAYIMPFSKSYVSAAMKYSKAYSDADVFSLDYRVAPKDTHPAALMDAIDGYHWLLSHGYLADDIIVCADSAGAGLSLAMTLKLRDDGEKLPKALILSSPWADLSAVGDSYKELAYKEAFFGTRKRETPKVPPVPIDYARGADVTDPYLSPIYASYEKMPPMLIQTGLDEVLLSDSQTVVHKAKNAGVKVKYIEYPGMYHTFYLVTPFIPEGKKAWKEIQSFIECL